MRIVIPEIYCEAINAIRHLYDVHGTGGYGHVVFDDGNYDFVRTCLNDARNETFKQLYDDAEDHEQVKMLSIKALESCESFSEDEVELCVVLYRALERGSLLRDL
jgi:hypothetical protein